MSFLKRKMDKDESTSATGASSSSATGASSTPKLTTDATLTTDSATAHSSKADAGASSDTKMKKMKKFLRSMYRGNDSDDDDNDFAMDPEERRMMKRMMRYGDPEDMWDMMDMMSMSKRHGDPDDMRDMMRMMMMHRHWGSRRDPFGDPYASRPPSQQCIQPPRESEQQIQQRNWKLPEMVIPDEPPEEESVENIEDLGSLNTDASLYTLTEQTDGQEDVHHIFLQMPSTLPEGMGNAVPSTSHVKNTLNVLMVDTSASMDNFFPPVATGWNVHVAPFLVGRTKIYTFSNSVSLRREGTSEDTESVKLQEADFDCGSTDLTGALQKLVEEIYKCKEKYVKVFLITDGDHNQTKVTPDTVIEMMKPPKGKVCDVFVLGAGRYFPVQYSINIRSRLHSGTSNIPSLFWAKDSNNTDEQLKDIGHRISDTISQTGKLSISGSTLPGLTPRNTFYLKEWVYLRGNQDLLTSICLTVGRYTGQIALSPQPITMVLLTEVFRQWNSVIIQLYNKKEEVPAEIIPFMERLFEALMTVMKSCDVNSIRNRLQGKELKTYDNDFKTLINKIKAILTTEKFQDQLELAENILSTTVGGSKYEAKSLQLKGHTDENYREATTAFMKVYDANKSKIQEIKTTPDECCHITLRSTITDLQDPDFSMMMDLNKFEFLKNFTITGIPVFAPVRDSALLNPWSLSIRHMVGAPYTILSQVAMESFAKIVGVEQKDKKVQLKEDDDNTRFNAIVPVFSKDAAKIMEPIARTELYAMCVTFGILKNPHIIDYNVHMASLGVTWVRILFEFPDQPRPEYVCSRIESIMATAALYIDRPSFAKYAAALESDTAQALMTESQNLFDGKTLKCESLIKPMFILYLIQQRQGPTNQVNAKEIVKLILCEYIGRCLSNYKLQEKNPTPYTDFFAEDFTDKEKIKEWLQKYVEEAKANVSGKEVFLLEDFYTLEKVQKAAKKVATETVEVLKNKLTAHIPVKVNMEKVERLRNVSSAGDVSWPTLKTFVRDIGLSSETINDLFSEESVFVYTYHALEYRSSRDRLSKPLLDYASAKDLALKKVEAENSHDLSNDLDNAVISQIQDSWLKAYFAAHAEVVKPMSRTQIIREATGLGIEVTEATFDQVYRKYRDHLGLLSNACQCRACPYFLQPNKRYNQHAIVERRGKAAFPHAFHHVAYEDRDNEVSVAISHIVDGSHSKSRNPVPQEVIYKYSNELKALKDMYSELNLG